MNNCGKGRCESEEVTFQYKIISSIFIITIISFIFSYILRLEKEKCECSQHWIKNKLKYTSIILIVLQIIYIFIEPNNYFGIVNLIITLSYILFCILFYFKLNCECSKNWQKYSLILPFFIPLFLIIFVILNR